MINSVASLLHEIMTRESKRLDREKIEHAPTIGAMYEGLTRDILDRAIPPSLHLRVVDGFIEGVDGKLSHQIDAMLVSGVGRKLPYGAGYVWPIKDVIAVFEIKKNLFGAELDDALKKNDNIVEMQYNYLCGNNEIKLDISPSFQALAQITGQYPSDISNITSISDGIRSIFRVLFFEQFSPIRIIWGYHGYTDEHALRNGIVNYLDKNISKLKHGIISLPSLIVCRNASILKMNGHPYSCPMDGDWWHLLTSNSENPLRLLIELIWTQISNRFQTHISMDDTLQMEKLAPFICTRYSSSEGKWGWMYRSHLLTRKHLSKTKAINWEPQEISDHEFVLISRVAEEGQIDLRDEDYRNYAERNGLDPDKLPSELIKRRILAWCDDHSVRLVNIETLITTFLPDGRIMCTGEADLFRLWIDETMKTKIIGAGDP